MLSSLLYLFLAFPAFSATQTSRPVSVNLYGTDQFFRNLDVSGSLHVFGSGNPTHPTGTSFFDNKVQFGAQINTSIISASAPYISVDNSAGLPPYGTTPITSLFLQSDIISIGAVYRKDFYTSLAGFKTFGLNYINPSSEVRTYDSGKIALISKNDEGLEVTGDYHSTFSITAGSGTFSGPVIISTNAVQLRITQPSLANGTVLQQSGLDFYLANFESGNMYFYTSAYPRMRIGPDGKIGMFTITPSPYGLDVATNTRVQTELVVGSSGSFLNGDILLGQADAFGRTTIWNRAPNSVLIMGANTADGNPFSRDSEGMVIKHPSDDSLGRIKADRFGLTRASDSNKYYFRVDKSNLFYRNDPDMNGDFLLYANRVSSFVAIGTNTQVAGENIHLVGSVLASGPIQVDSNVFINVNGPSPGGLNVGNSDTSPTAAASVGVGNGSVVKGSFYYSPNTTALNGQEAINVEADAPNLILNAATSGATIYFVVNGSSQVIITESGLSSDKTITAPTFNATSSAYQLDGQTFYDANGLHTSSIQIPGELIFTSTGITIDNTSQPTYTPPLDIKESGNVQIGVSNAAQEGYVDAFTLYTQGVDSVTIPSNQRVSSFFMASGDVTNPDWSASGYPGLAVVLNRTTTLSRLENDLFTYPMTPGNIQFNFGTNNFAQFWTAVNISTPATSFNSDSFTLSDSNMGGNSIFTVNGISQLNGEVNSTTFDANNNFVVQTVNSGSPATTRFKVKTSTNSMDFYASQITRGSNGNTDLSGSGLSAAQLHITDDGEAALVSNATGAQANIQPSGQILLEPASGQNVTTDGDFITTGTHIVNGILGVGTSNPRAQAEIKNNSQNQYALIVSSGNGDKMLSVDQFGHLGSSGTLVSLGTCTNGSLTNPSNDQTGQVVFSGANSSCHVDFVHSWKSPPYCFCNGDNHSGPNNVCLVVNHTATGFDMIPAAGAFGSTDDVEWFCFAPGQ